MSQAPFSLRPWPTGDKKPKNLGDFIARISAERGSFRNVTEGKLREEIKAEEDRRNGDGGQDEGSESDSEDADAASDKTKDVAAVREDFLKNIENAHQSAMMSLDFVSLLLSKESPVQAGSTLSPALRDLVGIGTLGASRLKESNITDVRQKDDLSVATGWRVLGINEVVESVVEAAERLEREMSFETKYWADVLAVSQNDWAITSLPTEPHTLRVRFGFAEAAPEYRNASLAPLQRNDDGSVRLAHRRANGDSQRVQVAIERNGTITGRSSLPKQTLDTAPLQDRVLEARNTIFSQELWHEINREARMLLSLGVHSDGTSVTYELDKASKMIITLEDLDDTSVDPEPTTDNETAEILAVCLHILLSYAHRQNYARRSHPTQQSSARNQKSNDILRPVIVRLNYQNVIDTLNSFLEGLKYVLHQAGIDTAAFSTNLSTINIQTAGQPKRSSKVETLINSIVADLQVSTELAITPEARINLRGKAFMFPVVVKFMVTLPDAAPSSTTSQDNQDDATPPPANRLQEWFPPPESNNQPNYPSIEEVLYYLRQATIRALAGKNAEEAARQLEREDITWTETPDGVAITAHDERLLFVDIEEERPILTLQSRVSDGEAVQGQKWVWGPGTNQQQSLEEVVIDFFRT
jgi:mediator of RNA polymerase II transcription subunit 17, fungi type